MARLYAFQMGDMGNFSDSDYRYHHCDENNYQPEVANSSGPMSPVSSPHFATTFHSDADALMACLRVYPDSTSSRAASYSPQPPTPPCEQSGQPKDLAHTSQGSPYMSDSPQSPPGSKPAPKRKRENRYKDAPPSVLSRRRAQNRASQRAYRERKDQRIKDLEVMLSEQKQRNDALSQAYTTLHTQYMGFRAAQVRIQPPTSMYDMPTTMIATGLAPSAGSALGGDVFLYQNLPAYTG